MQPTQFSLTREKQCHPSHPKKKANQTPFLHRWKQCCVSAKTLPQLHLWFCLLRVSFQCVSFGSKVEHLIYLPHTPTVQCSAQLNFYPVPSPLSLLAIPQDKNSCFCSCFLNLLCVMLSLIVYSQSEHGHLKDVCDFYTHLFI